MLLKHLTGDQSRKDQTFPGEEKADNFRWFRLYDGSGIKHKLYMDWYASFKTTRYSQMLASSESNNAASKKPG